MCKTGVDLDDCVCKTGVALLVSEFSASSVRPVCKTGVALAEYLPSD